MIGRILTHPFVLGFIAFCGYETYKSAKLNAGPAGGFTMVPGHLNVFQLKYSGAGIGPMLTENQVQQALDAGSAGLFDVVSASDNQATKTVSVSAVYTGKTTAGVTPAHLTQGWPSSYGVLTVASVQDTGSAPQVTPSASIG